MACCRWLHELCCPKRHTPTKIASPVPDDILKALEEAFKYNPEAHARVLFFLAHSQATGVAEPYIRSLQSAIQRPSVFKSVAERMVEDTQTADKDPKYRQVMQDEFMKDDSSEHPETGQNLDVALPTDRVTTAVQYSFMRSVARLTPESIAALRQVAQSVSGPLAVYTDKALSQPTGSAGEVVRVALVAYALANDIIKNINRWWNGEISGEICVKNIIDNGINVAAGVAGGFGGEIIGATVGSVAGPAGAVVGGLVGAGVGALLGATAANALCDCLTQWVFGLPKDEALENAYNFLGVSPKDSNSGINSRYRKLSLQYHPDKGGNPDKWTQLQYSMAVIRAARGDD